MAPLGQMGRVFHHPQDREQRQNTDRRTRRSQEQVLQLSGNVRLAAESAGSNNRCPRTAETAHGWTSFRPSRAP